MANCQNNVRYGRQNRNWQQRQSGQSCGNNVGACAETARACEICETRAAGCSRETRTNDCTRETRTDECERKKRTHKSSREDKLQGMPLAMAYVPWQRWGNLYCACKALQAGTVFEELDKPFLGRGGCNR